MNDSSRSPLPKYAKYLPDYELPPSAVKVTTMSPQNLSHLKVITIMLSLICLVSTVYLIACLIVAPHTSDPQLSVSMAAITWLPFGLVPGLSALVCWSVSKAQEAAQG